MGRDLRGQIIDQRYRVEFLLGSGGMGDVWAVVHTASLQRHALKTLETWLAPDADARERLLREARSAASLQTKHVVKIIDARVDYVHEGEPLPYLVMERLDGLTLEDWLGLRGPLTPGEVIWIARQVGRALELAHASGIVHRDLKPSNVFLARDDEGAVVTKLCDFGIAKLTGNAAAHLLSRGAALTRTGDVLGTPLYLAPELLRGGEYASPLSDQWAFALLIFRALTAQEYFGDAEQGPELVLRIAQDPLRPPSTLASLSEGFDAWFLRSCARSPSRRFADLREQVDSLATALGHPAPAQPVLDRGSSRGQGSSGGTTRLISPPGPMNRQRLWARLASAIGLAWVMAAALWLWLSATGGRDSRQVPPPRASVASRITAASNPGDSIEPEPPRVAPFATSSSLAPRPPSRPERVAAAHSGTRVEANPKHSASNVARVIGAPETSVKRASGLSCSRSVECANGLCVAERCQ